MRFYFRNLPIFCVVSLAVFLPCHAGACAVELSARHLSIDHKKFDQASKKEIAERLTACGDTLQVNVNVKATIGNFFDLLDALKLCGKRFDLHVKKQTFKGVLPRDVHDSVDAGGGDPVSDLGFSLVGPAGHEQLFISSGS